MHKSVFIALCLVFYSSADSIPNNVVRKPNLSILDLLFSKNYTDYTPTLYSGYSFKCPKLAKPGCEIKLATNTMLKTCKVCVIREGDFCDPMLDGCEVGTICLPKSMNELNVNVCTKFDPRDYFAVVNKFKKNKAKTFNKTTGKKTLKRYQKEKTKYDRLTKKFVNYKHPCMAHKNYLKKKRNNVRWQLHCKKDGFYSDMHKTCIKSRCWCVDRLGRFQRKARKNNVIEYCGRNIPTSPDISTNVQN